MLNLKHLILSSQKLIHKSNLKLIIRGHQCVQKGIEKHLDGLVYTVFSSSNYPPAGNCCGYLIIDQNGHIEKKVFEFKAELKRADVCFYDVRPEQKNQTKLGHPTCFSNRRFSTLCLPVPAAKAAMSMRRGSVVKKFPLLKSAPLNNSQIQFPRISQSTTQFQNPNVKNEEEWAHHGRQPGIISVA